MCAKPRACGYPSQHWLSRARSLFAFNQLIQHTFGKRFSRWAGFSESTDAGETWKVVAPLPPGFGGGLIGPNYAWDMEHDVLYASSMGKPAYRYERRRAGIP